MTPLSSRNEQRESSSPSRARSSTDAHCSIETPSKSSPTAKASRSIFRAQQSQRAPSQETASYRPNLYYKHIGLYVYPKAVLTELTRIPPSPLELAERLEQLRALENGIRIRLEETEHDSLGVDTVEDLEAVRALIAGRVTVQ